MHSLRSRLPSILSAFSMALVPTALFAQNQDLAPAGGGPRINLPTGLTRPQAEGTNVIYDNGPYVNLPAGGFGGADASVLQNAAPHGHTIFGYGASSADVRLADDFTVPGGQLWYVESVKFYAYRTGTLTNFAFETAALQVWDGDPSSGSANVIFGDTTTNRLISSTWDNSYRVLDATPTVNNRPVMEIEVRVGKLFKPGTYWLDYWVNTTVPGSAFLPPITITGQDVTGNGLQFIATNVPPVPFWNPLVTAAANYPTGMPFQLCGTVACCWESALGTNLGHGDDTITDNLALGFNFPLPGELPGGATTPVVSVCSNGFVGLGGSFGPDFTPSSSEFISQGHRIAVPWEDFVPNTSSAPQRQVWFNALPGRAVATWRRVPTFLGGPSLSMVQLQMFPNGSFFINVWNHEPVTVRTPVFGVSAGNSSPSVAIDMTNGHVGVPGTATIFEEFVSGTSDLSGFIYCFDPVNDGNRASYNISLSDACCNDAVNQNYGSGCAGLSLTSTTPLAGQNVVLTMSGISGTAAAAVLTFGVTQSLIPIDPINAPGCDILTGLEFPGALPLSPTGPTLSALIPCNAKFFGQTIYVQGLVLDPQANVAGVASSNGVRLTIGND